MNDTRWLLCAIVTLAALAANQICLGQIPSAGIDTFQAPPDPQWSAITTQDVEAAYQLLRDNHPGAAPEVHDLGFVRRLNNAHELAARRARSITSYQGYVAVLAGFAVAIGDKHIWSRPTFVVNLPQWTGIIVSKRANRWVVTETDEARRGLLSASLISCDGEDIQQLARRNLGGFRVVWSVGAQQIQSAPWLLVDEGNPLIARPRQCKFDKDGAQHTEMLEWMRIKRETLLPMLKRAGGAGASGFGVRRVGEGYWIAIQDLSSVQSREVVKAVDDQKLALREAPFVVLDVRGNGGGSSEIADRIAASLYGGAESLRSTASDSCNDGQENFRASIGNIAQLQYLLTARFVTDGSTTVQQAISDELRDARAARSAGRQMVLPVNRCMNPPQQTQPSLLKSPLILVTDNLCFSSCLALTQEFRELGAYQVGQTTDAATWYVDVRETYLPSGYSLFSTLQAIGGSTEQVGPFEPALSYDGDMADTAALEKWVISTAVPMSRRAIH
jgi:hypothetical protein